MFNFISVTAVSRDGENALFMKYIPVELYKQCKYKVLPSIILNLFPLAYVVVLIKIFVPEVAIITIIEIIVGGLLSNIAYSYFSICIDILKPKLAWTSEYSVVKQNINMLYGAILQLVIMGIIISICAYIDNMHIAILAVSSFLIITLIIYEIFLRKFSRQLFKKVA